MLGCTSSGCFIVGIIIGFILSLVVVTACIFYFNPSLKAQIVSHVEQMWGSVKSNVDTSIEVVKKAPVAEPVKQGAEPQLAPPASPGKTNTPSANAPASSSAKPQSPGFDPASLIPKPKAVKISW